MSDQKKFELTTLSTDNIQEIDGFREKQMAIVSENPFLEITDSETFKEAKKRRTALKTARTEIEKQDKTLATFITKFRKALIGRKEELILITKPHEEKQQAEIDRYQKLIDDKKEEEAQKEKRRIEAIEDQIQKVKGEVTGIIIGTTFENIKSSREEVAKVFAKESQFDYEEYKYQYDQTVQDLKIQFEETATDLKEQEAIRIEALTGQRIAKINEIEVELTNKIDQSTYGQMIQKEELESTFDQITFDFGDQLELFNQMKERIIQKNNSKVENLIEQKKKDDELQELRLLKEKQEKLDHQRKSLNEKKESFLDIINQMTIETHIKDTKTIMDGTKKSVHLLEELTPLFNEIISEVKEALKIKLEYISEQLEKKKQEEDQLFQEKIKTLNNAGFVKKLNEDVLTSWGVEVSFAEIANNNVSFDVLFEKVKKSVEEAKLEEKKKQESKERAERLDPEKQSLTNYLDEIFMFEIDSYTDSKEMEPLLELINNDFVNFIALVKERINQF